jgi:hypothetical protein
MQDKETLQTIYAALCIEAYFSNGDFLCKGLDQYLSLHV